MKKLKPLFLSLLSALLLSLAWQKYFTPLIFIAFVPLLFIADEELVFKSKRFIGPKKFGLYYLCFLVWNLLITWWVYNASPAAIAAWILNSLFMVWTLRLAWWTKKRFTSNWSYFIIIPFWLAFEYFHQNWDLSWTWLTLGNVFYHQTELVQWFEITGTSGGSAWVLAINILIFLLLKNKIQNKVWSKKLSLNIALLLFIPALISFVLYQTLDLRMASSRLQMQTVAVVQPNVDPYNEKFVLNPEIQINKSLALCKEKISAKQWKDLDYLIFPETFLTNNYWEKDINDEPELISFRDTFSNGNATLQIISGGNTLKLYGPNEKLSATARKFTQENGHYDIYNAAIQFCNNAPIQIYRKSKLVPGSEIMPFISVLKPLENYALDLGGTVGSLGLQKERSVFLNCNNGIKVAPIICYESVYPEYVSEYVNNGANMLTIITNDGWWGDTPGYKQHLAYGAMRAIETRKPIARSANTGISCFINEKGQIYNTTQWWTPDLRIAELYPNTYKTIFVRLGDVLAKCSCFFTVFLFVWALILRFRKKAK